MHSGAFLVQIKGTTVVYKTHLVYHSNIQHSTRPFLQCSRAINSQVSVLFSYTTQCNKQRNCNARCVWMRLIRIECESAEFALNAHFKSHSCRQALNWVHSLAGLDSPATNPLVQATLQGLKRMLAHPIQKNSPITSEMLQEISMDAINHPTLANLWLAAPCLLAYSGVLRFDELIHVRMSDVIISPKMMKVKIPRSKTDQGDEILIARSYTPRCPVAMLERYMEKGQIQSEDKEFLFRGITKTKFGEKLWPAGSLSYTTMRELFKKKLNELGHASGEFGLHSLRAGGATAAAKAGVPDRLFKCHGRWKSETAKDGYVEDSVENRLAVSRNIGL